MNINGRRLLVVKQSSLGDVVHTLPLVHALKRCVPNCVVGWVVEQGYAALVEADDAVDRVYPMHIPSTSSPGSTWRSYGQALVATIGALRDLRQSLAREPYDIVLDLHASFRSGLLALANPGGLRIGFRTARELNALFQHRLIDVPPEVTHAVDKNLLFASFLGCPAQAADFRLCTGYGDDLAAAAFLRASGISDTERFVYVNPTARWSSKFWFVSRWSELCDRLTRAGVRPILGGSGADLPYIRRISEHMVSGAVISAGRLTLIESAALMKKAAAYVGLDTGPMHIAAMAGVPVAALFGPTHPERVAPYGVPRAIVQAKDLSCLCCRKRACARLDCMRGIGVDQVFSALMSLIETSASL